MVVLTVVDVSVGVMNESLISEGQGSPPYIWRNSQWSDIPMYEYFRSAKYTGRPQYVAQIGKFVQEESEFESESAEEALATIIVCVIK